MLLKLTPKLPLNTLRLIYTWDPSVFKECDDARVFVNADTAGETPCIVRSRRLHVARCMSVIRCNQPLYVCGKYNSTGELFRYSALCA